jgi:hypothetical protein
MDLPAILERSVELIDVHGWGQGGHSGRLPRLCLVEAINQAAGGSAADRRLANDACRVVSKHIWPGADLGIPGSALVEWNDEKGRTEGEVRDALLHTAKELRNADT